MGLASWKFSAPILIHQMLKIGVFGKGFTNNFILSYKIQKKLLLECFTVSLNGLFDPQKVGKLCSGGFTTMKTSLYLKCAILENIVDCILVTKV